MAVEVYEYFYLFGVLLLLSFEVRDYSFQLWEKVIPVRVFLDVPVSIEIITLNSCPIIAQDHSIDIDHRQQDPTIRIRIFHQFLNKTLHHPRSNTLSRVLPSHSHNHNITASILVHNKCFYLIAQNSPRNVYLEVA